MNLIPPISTTPVAPLPGNGLEPGDNPLVGVEGPIFYDEFLAALAKGSGGEGGAELPGSTAETVVPEGETPPEDLQGLPAEVTSQLVDQANFSPTVASGTGTGVPSITRDVPVTTLAGAPSVVPPTPAEAVVLAEPSEVLGKATRQPPAERSAVPQELTLARDLPTVDPVGTTSAEVKVANSTPNVPQAVIAQDSLTTIPKDTARVTPQGVSVPQTSSPESTPLKTAVTISATAESSGTPNLMSQPTPEVSSADRQASVQLSSVEISVSPEALIASKTASPIATSMPGSAAAAIVNLRTEQGISQTESSVEASTTPMVEELEASLVSAPRSISPEARDQAVSLAAATVSSDTTRVIARSSGEIPTEAGAITAADLDLIDPVSSSVQRVTSVNLETRSGTLENTESNDALIENNATQWRFDMRSSTPVSALAESSNQNSSGTQANGSTVGNAMVSDTSASATAAEKFVSTLLGIASSSQPSSAADRTINELKHTTTIVSAPHMARWDAAAVQVELVRMIKDGGGQVVMKLTPPDEGSFRIDLSLDPERGVRIFVEGASDSVKTRLEQGAEQLREQFSQMGFNLQLDLHSRRESSSQAAGFGFAESSDLGDIGGGRAASAEAGADIEVAPAARRRSMIDESRVYFRA